MKSEPDEFSIDDLVRAPKKTTPWFGVRNYQARNYMRDAMRVGDGVLFYHSSCAVPGIAGLAEVAEHALPGRDAVRPEEPVLRPQGRAREPALDAGRREAREEDAASPARRAARPRGARRHGDPASAATACRSRRSPPAEWKAHRQAPRAAMPGDALTWLTYAGLGVFVGFFSGLLGIGGGSMIVPILGLVFVAFGFPPDQVMHLSLGTSLAAIIVATASGARAHHAARRGARRHRARARPGHRRGGTRRRGHRARRPRCLPQVLLPRLRHLRHRADPLRPQAHAQPPGARRARASSAWAR